RDRGRLAVAGELVDDVLPVRGVLLQLDHVQLRGEPAHLLELGDVDAVDLDAVVVAREGVGGKSGESGRYGLLHLLGGFHSVRSAPLENWAWRKITNSAGFKVANPITTFS